MESDAHVPEVREEPDREVPQGHHGHDVTESEPQREFFTASHGGQAACRVE